MDQQQPFGSLAPASFPPDGGAALAPISPSAIELLRQKLLEAYPPTVAAPMPRPDPRGSTFATRIPQGHGSPLGTEFPPSVLLGAKGLDDVSRKNGDAIDFGGNPKLWNDLYATLMNDT